MNLSSAMSNALSGLTSSARGANVVSSNLANALTEGYGKRELSLSSRSGGAGGGVEVNGINREVDHALIGDRRLADAELSNAETSAGYLARLESLIGTPEDDHALTSHLAEFETTLIEAASRPDSEIRLASVVHSAKQIATTLNGISDGIQKMRGEADTSIALQVQRMNDALSGVEQLNKDIMSASGQGRETAALEDQRQTLIDEVSAMVPIKQVSRDRGAVALFTPGGAILLEGQAAKLEFSKNNVIAPHMTQANGMLSGLTVNGVEVSTAGSGAVGGGSLSALFAVRDDLLASAQAKVDIVAKDLALRFQTGLDGSLPAGEAGLFTDVGEPATQAIGLAGRISVNALVDPDENGALWKLRDGLGASTPGAVGNSDLLQSMRDAMRDARIPSEPDLGTSAVDMSGLASAFLSDIGSKRTQSDQSLAFASARQFELKQSELADGVDSDHELQKLMLIEQAYAANAKVIQAVDEMLQALMRIAS